MPWQSSFERAGINEGRESGGSAIRVKPNGRAGGRRNSSAEQPLREWQKECGSPKGHEHAPDHVDPPACLSDFR